MSNSPQLSWTRSISTVRVRRTGSGFLYTFGLALVLLVIWQIATTLVPSPFFPPPWTIMTNGASMFFGGDSGALVSDAVRVDIVGTVTRMLLGFILGSVFGILFGVVIGLSRIAKDVTAPVIEFLRSIPASATLPLFIVLLGGDDGMRVAFIAYGVMWFVLINTAAGVGSIHPTQLAVGQAFRISRWKQLTGIVLPAASPKIFAGLRIANTAALMLAIVSEFMLATNGIGHQLLVAQSRFQLVNMWSWMFVLALLGLLLNTLLELIEKRMLGWHRLSRR